MRVQEITDFVQLTTHWHGGLYAPTPENLGTDVSTSFRCIRNVEPELSVDKKIEQAENMLLDLADHAYEAFSVGNFELEQALDDRAALIRAQICKWKKAAGMAAVLVEDDQK